MFIGLVHYAANTLERLSNRSSTVAIEPNNSIVVNKTAFQPNSTINSTEPLRYKAPSSFWKDMTPHLDEATTDLKQADAHATTSEEFQTHLKRLIKRDGFRPAHVFYANKIDSEFIRTVTKEFFEGEFWNFDLYEGLMGYLSTYKLKEVNKQFNSLANELREENPECVKKLQDIGFNDGQIRNIAQLPNEKTYQRNFNTTYFQELKAIEERLFEKNDLNFWKPATNSELILRIHNEFFNGDFWNFNLYEGFGNLLNCWAVSSTPS